MKRALILFTYILLTLSSYGQIIADHTVVDKYDDIPQQYIDEVKKMWLSYAGESHSEAIRDGLEALEALDATFAVNVTESGTPEAYTTSHLRASGATWGDINNVSGWIYSYGGEDWYLTETAISRTKAGITYCNSNSLTISAFGFGWCWDVGANFNAYISATQEYVDYCADNSIDTEIFFTTGTVDTYTGEDAYEKHLGYEMIRDYVSADNNLVLFDYADILCYNNSGELETDTWDGHTFPIIHPDNEDGGYTGHIGMNGAIRLAKAMWWMLARIAGWDGSSSTVIPVESITVSGEGGSSSITTDGGTLQLTATVLPSNATNKTVTWSISNGTGEATISSSGLVTAVDNGTVTARATASDGSGVYGQLVITISNQEIPVTGITVNGEGGSSTISTYGGTLQLTATVLPSDATDKTVTWSISNGSGEASISSTGLVTAISNGTVTARATANDGSGVYGQLVITITNQEILVTGITVSGEGGSSSITNDGGTLQLTATILPSNATNKTVTWSIINGTGRAIINSTGLVTAVTNGTVTARATANDGSGVFGDLIITISNQGVRVSSITVTGAGGSSTISTDGGTLQLTATVLPSDATNKTVTWSISNGSGEASISSTGLVTAIDNGTVTARATANDGSGVFGEMVITITNQVIPVTGITVTGAGGSSTISTDGGTLQLTATVLPSNATNKTVTWSISNGSGEASISSTGLVTAIDNGTVTARATANDGSGVYGQLVITISNQIIPVTGITVSGAGGSSTISTDGGTLQLTATVSPADATNKTVTWSIINGTGEASISSSGLVTAVDNGTVTARATANDGSGVYGQLVITISNQVIPVTGITVTGAAGSSSITTEGGTLQLTANIAPSKATDKTVTWSITNVSGEATISSSGLVTAVSNGTVIARATANDGSGVYGELTITITNQYVAVSGITINTEGGQTTINIPGGTLQLQAVIDPEDASDTSVTWEVINGTGEAEISPTGLLTAISEGTVTVRVTANDGSGISATIDIIIEYFEYDDFRVIIHEGMIEVLFNEDHSGYNLSLYDFMGSLRNKEIIDGISCQFNTSLLSPGPYYIILSTSVIHEVRKVLLVK